MTLCSTVPALDVLVSISQYAFKASPYPVILSLENHLTLRQQTVFAQMCISVFGNTLLTEKLVDNEIFPSPEALKYKIIIKAKVEKAMKCTCRPADLIPRQSNTSANSILSNEMEDDEWSINKKNKRQSLASFKSLPNMMMSRKLRSRDSMNVRRRNTDPESSDVSTPVLPAALPHHYAGPPLSSSNDAVQMHDAKEKREKELRQAATMPDRTKPNSLASKQSLTEKDEKEAASTTTPEIGPGIGPSADSMDSDDEAVEEMETVDFAPELVAITIYCQAAKFKTFEHARNCTSYLHMSSFGEKKAFNLVKKFPAEMVGHTAFQLARVYPSGQRLDSTNYNPHRMWSVGVQMVALNYQSPGRAMHLNTGFFRQNGGCGYILKPDYLCHPEAGPPYNPFTDQVNPQYLDIKLLGGHFHGMPNREVSVRWELVGPIECQKEEVPAATVQGAIAEWHHEVRLVVDNPDLSILYVRVKDHKEVFGQNCGAVHTLRPGYRNIPLRTQTGARLHTAMLFVHITITAAPHRIISTNDRDSITPANQSSSVARGAFSVARSTVSGIKRVGEIIAGSSSSRQNSLADDSDSIGNLAPENETHHGASIDSGMAKSRTSLGPRRHLVVPASVTEEADTEGTSQQRTGGGNAV